ncbi:TetR/AcrR family transcriptional regulator [Wukongibacter baidiensis]|uniref:TetR/AcrR family transcriptional regulator n=1 Tax=Wukongibacter baidiensis TaxID=1723361 RepID=UPI003D7FA94A
MDNKKKKREAIIFSALAIFERDGFHKAKVEDIAKGANVGKGTIYEYFKSKKDLFYQMVKSLMNMYFEQIQSVAEENVDPISSLEELTKLQLDTECKHGSLGHVIHVEAIKSGIGKDLKDVYIEFRSKQIKLIQGIINKGIESGIFKEVDTDMAALFFIGGVNQFAFEVNHLNKYECKKDVDIKKFLDAFLKGVLK